MKEFIYIKDIDYILATQDLLNEVLYKTFRRVVNKNDKGLKRSDVQKFRILYSKDFPLLNKFIGHTPFLTNLLKMTDILNPDAQEEKDGRNLVSKNAVSQGL